MFSLKPFVHRRERLTDMERPCNEETPLIDNQKPLDVTNTPSAEHSSLTGTMKENQLTHPKDLESERGLLPLSQTQEDSNFAVPAHDTELKDLSHKLEAATTMLKSSETERHSAETKLAISNSVCDHLRKELKASRQVTSMFNMMEDLLDVRSDEVVNAVTQLKNDHRQRIFSWNWLHTQTSTYWKKRTIAAENRLRIYTEVGCPAQTRAARDKTKIANRCDKATIDEVPAKDTALQFVIDKLPMIEEAISIDKARVKVLEHLLHVKSLSELQLQQELRVANRNNETLTRSVRATEQAQKMMQRAPGKLPVLEEVLFANKGRIKDLEHELKAESLSLSQMREENNTLLAQLELARTKAESVEQTLLEHLESTRTNGRVTEQALLDRLETVILKRLEPTGPESVLQALVNDQETALADVQEQLAMADADRLGIREELATANGDLLEIQQRLEKALAVKTQALRHARRELSTTLTKHKTTLEELTTALGELLEIRTERKGIYKTLKVKNCLGAHLAIGSLKVAQLDYEVLQRAIGDFEDEAAVHEIKRLKKANVELVKVESALDGVDGSSNVAKIENLKAACGME